MAQQKITGIQLDVTTISGNLGAITPTSVASSGSVTGTNLSGSSSGTNTGDQTITLTGDITGTGTGSFAATLATVNSSPQTDTFRRITVNGKGLLTATTAVGSADITTALGYTPVNKAGDTMTGLLILSAAPAVALGAATKQYVDTVAIGLAIHQSAVAGTTVNLTSTYNNATAGVGATLTNSGAFAALVIDTVTLAVNDRVLVKNQSTQYENGIYVVTDIGSGSTNWILTRSADFDNSPVGEIQAGDTLFITNGSQTSTQWVQITTGTITVGTTAIVFTQFGGPGTYSAGTGIGISSNIISNTGVLSNIAGSGISVSSASGNVTIANTGVTSAVAGTNISVSSSTGAVTIAVTGTVPSATSATTSTNIDGGSAGNILYQSAAATTATLSTGTSSQVLISGTTPSWTNTPTLTGTNFSSIPNSALTNSSLTLGSTGLTLGSTTTTIVGLTSVTSTTFVGALTGAASANVLKAGDTMSGVFNEAPITTIASGSLVNLSTATSNTINVTGANTINTFGTIASGARRTLMFSGACTITNSASIINATGADILTVANQALEYVSLGGNVWQQINSTASNSSTGITADDALILSLTF
jgi:hypothetical protein